MFAKIFARNTPTTLVENKLCQSQPILLVSPNITFNVQALQAIGVDTKISKAARMAMLKSILGGTAEGQNLLSFLDSRARNYKALSSTTK